MENSPSGLVQPSLLEKIDSLFACNVGNYVDLPQLVVVGHQSSGKSSVLEGLTGLPFPRDSGLCTRFATQITFRRSNSSSIAVSIIPAKDSSEDHQCNMKAWGKRSLESFNVDSMAAIMQEATTQMLFSSADGVVSPFSNDVLAIEIAGPGQEHFSIIDVPGTFKRTTAGMTTKADISLVDEMVHGYMANPRSVMLAVVPCNVDIANQEIIEKAEDLDPDGDRTFGVLTKPDLVDRGAEVSVVEVMESKRQKLKLGWHMLRNPGQADLFDSVKRRRILEREFFDSVPPWNKLSKDTVGIESLRIRLQEILAGHIRREFPKVKAEINAKWRSVNEAHKSLGPKRQSELEQRDFLVNIASKFQDISKLATRADYGRDDFFEGDDSRRLATATVNRGKVFAEHMANCGHEISFELKHDTESLEEVKLEKLGLDENETLPTRHVIDHPDVDDLVSKCAKLPLPCDSGILEWLKSVYRRSCGFELGTFDSILLATTMKIQARKWREFTLGYVSDMITLVHKFVVQVLQHIVPGNRHVRDGLASFFSEPLRKRYEAALNHSNFLLDVELEGTPATYNHYFKDTLDKSRQTRLRNQLSSKSFSDCSHGEVVRLNDLVQNHPLSNDDHIILELHDILQSYYKLSRKRFVDNVRMQVVDHHLVTGHDSPLELFSPKTVATMTSEQLEDIAGEELGTKRRRAELEKEMQRLEEGRREGRRVLR